MKRLHPLLIGLASTLFLNSCAALQTLTNFKKPKVFFKNLHLTNLSLDSMTLDFELGVKNDNPVGVKIASIQHSLAFDGHNLWESTQKKAMKIGANKTSPVRVPITIKFSDFAQSIAAFLSSKDQVPFAFASKIGLDTPAGVISVPVNHKGSVPLPKLPAVSVSSVEVKQLSPLGAKMAFNINVQNRGKFPIRMKDLAYALSLSGSKISGGNMNLGDLPSGQAQKISIPLNLNFLKLGSSVVSAIKTKKLPYQVSGDLNLGLFKHPFSLAGTARL